MIDQPAQYLLRFDDLCPTMSRERWQRFLPLLSEYKVSPILAIVPENHDPALKIEAPNEEFWQQMRQLELNGATIGLHGYRHLCTQRGRSLVPLHRVTEFAGAPEEIQCRWICSGLEILRSHGLNPRIWVAPRHGFDRATLRALLAERIDLVSDGFARRPFLRGGIRWIPQQLWEPVKKQSGLWTICLHTNNVSDRLFNKIAEFIHGHASQFTSVDRVLSEFTVSPLSPVEELSGLLSLYRIRARQFGKKFLSR